MTTINNFSAQNLKLATRAINAHLAQLTKSTGLRFFVLPKHSGGATASYTLGVTLAHYVPFMSKRRKIKGHTSRAIHFVVKGSSQVLEVVEIKDKSGTRYECYDLLGNGARGKGVVMNIRQLDNGRWQSDGFDPKTGPSWRTPSAAFAATCSVLY